MDIKKILESELINKAALARILWPVPKDKINDQEYVKKHHNSVSVRLDQKLKGIQNRKFTDYEAKKIQMILKELFSEKI